QRTEGGWQQTNAPREENAFFSVVELAELVAPSDPTDQTDPTDRSDAPNPSQLQAALTRKATELQASLNLESEPLLCGCYFDFGPDEPARLLIAIHHLAVDGVSWRVLLDDLQSALDQIARGETVRLPEK